MLDQILAEISNVLWGWPMIIMLLGTHLFLTVRLRFPQRYIIRAIRLTVSSDKDAKGDVSQFGALATALAATIGTGNIIGVGTAIALGGPGAVFWCWMTGVLGMATKYGEGLLAIKYRQVSPKGRMQGGPMYALEYGLAARYAGWKRWLFLALAIFFALFTTIASLSIGSSVQSNAISTLTTENYGISPVVMGLVITLLVGLVIIGGVKSISRVCSMLVPVMALVYVVGCIIILVLNADYIWPALKVIVCSAFSAKAMGGGFAGTAVLMAIRFGIARGLFSNESGLGSAPIVAAAAQTKNPVRQALVSSSGTFWDTVVICAMTGIVIVSCCIAHPEINVADGGALTSKAFANIPYIGTPLLSFGLLTFAFSTILGWSYYGERATQYLGSKKVFRKVGLHTHVCIWIYRIIFLSTVFLGAVMPLQTVWNIADISNALMAFPNLISLLLLSGVMVEETRKHLWDKEK